MSGGDEHPQVEPGAPHALREYALLADGARAALVGPRGDISWLCAPRWDSGSVFSALIGGRGTYSVTPRLPYVWGGSYEPGTLVWRSRWVTHEGIVECREALAYPGEPGRVVLLRRIVALTCTARLAVVLRPRADYDRAGVRRWRCADGVWSGVAGGLRLRWSGAATARPNGAGTLAMDIDVPAGRHHDLVLEMADTELPDRPPAADVTWRATSAAWSRAVPVLDAVRASTDTRHSYAVLRGLTGAGGTVAAATTSLPERAGDDRNYDYRYVWVRDQCLVGQAAAAARGTEWLLDTSVDVVAARLLEYGAGLAPAYTVVGDAIPESRHLELPGYPGGHDVVGNQVRDQFQLDVFGEAMLLFAAAARRDRADARTWRAAAVAAGAAAQRWQQPDGGMWELHPRAWTHSRLIVAAGLRAIAATAPGGCASRADWVALADRIVADTASTALHPDGRWQRTPDDPACDAALLFPGIRGAVPSDDPRTAATLAAFLRELTVDGFAYRFRHDDRPLHEAEGSFLLCGFATALALNQQGRRTAAVGWYERTRAACGPPQLFSEEYDAVQHQLRGNLPQSFVHALMIESSAVLAGEE